MTHLVVFTFQKKKYIWNKEMSKSMYMSAVKVTYSLIILKTRMNSIL